MGIFVQSYHFGHVCLWHDVLISQFAQTQTIYKVVPILVYMH